MRQPWIYSPLVDGVFILGIPFFVVAVTLIFSDLFGQADSMTVVSWAVLVMGVDVSHVYSTLYRTYFDTETQNRHRAFLYLLPFVVFVACMGVYNLGAHTFWRVMAYLAVFHFARQQYGFMRIYARSESQAPWLRRLDALAVYTATLYPVIDWHLAGQKNFNWFMKGDFIYFPSLELGKVLFGLYGCVIVLYLAKEATQIWRCRSINIPRNGILAGTFLSWYVGIVHFNSDLAFTAINVISHGIPYMALVWIYGRKKYFPAEHAEAKKSSPLPKRPGWSLVFRPRFVALFIVSLLILAYIEEGLWDVWVWNERGHRDFFAVFHSVFGEPVVNSPWLKIAVPLLSVPQITHYVIDGFIWKMKKDAFNWRDITLKAPTPVPSPHAGRGA